MMNVRRMREELMMGENKDDWEQNVRRLFWIELECMYAFMINEEKDVYIYNELLIRFSFNMQIY